MSLLQRVLYLSPYLRGCVCLDLEVQFKTKNLLKEVFLMEKHYEIFVGIDVSKGKADAAIYKVSNLRSIKPIFLRKKLSFKFTQSDVLSFLSTVREKYDNNCTNVTFGLEVTGIYSNNVYNFIKSNLTEFENIHFLNTEFVNDWRKTRGRSKSDPLDAQTIATIIGADPDVQYVSDDVFENKNGYQDLKALTHRYYQVKKTFSQENNRLIAQCDMHFPELQYVFETNSAAFLAILSSYPTTQDIINASKSEVFDLVYEATKHRVKMDKIDKLFEYCNDTLTSSDTSDIHRQLVKDLVNSIKSIKAQIRDLEKQIKSIASNYPEYDYLTSITGCGPITAAVVIAEVGNVKRFSSADKFVSYSGATPKIDRSGSSVDKVHKISKKGSKYLRHALYMIAEFARRHNPVLRAHFQRIKNGNKKRHRLALIAVANKIARYIYSAMKNKSSFVITYESLMRLPEETRNTFFNSITTDFPEKTRRQIYQYSDKYGEVHRFTYTSKQDLELV